MYVQDEMIPDMNKDQEALLISLIRPVVYVQPVSFDKGQFRPQEPEVNHWNDLPANVKHVPSVQMFKLNVLKLVFNCFKICI